MSEWWRPSLYPGWPLSRQTTTGTGGEAVGGRAPRGVSLPACMQGTHTHTHTGPGACARGGGGCPPFSPPAQTKGLSSSPFRPPLEAVCPRQDPLGVGVCGLRRGGPTVRTTIRPCAPSLASRASSFQGHRPVDGVRQGETPGVVVCVGTPRGAELPLWNLHSPPSWRARLGNLEVTIRRGQRVHPGSVVRNPD